MGLSLTQRTVILSSITGLCCITVYLHPVKSWLSIYLKPSISWKTTRFTPKNPLAHAVGHLHVCCSSHLAGGPVATRTPATASFPCRPTATWSPPEGGGPSSSDERTAAWTSRGLGKSIKRYEQSLGHLGITPCESNFPDPHNLPHKHKPTDDSGHLFNRRVVTWCVRPPPAPPIKHQSCQQSWATRRDSAREHGARIRQLVLPSPLSGALRCPHTQPLPQHEFPPVQLSVLELASPGPTFFSRGPVSQHSDT